MSQQALPFGGDTYDPDLDGKRLGRQLRAVKALMMDGRWRTLAEIEAVTGYPQASVSARLRDLRKPWAGDLPVDRRRRSAGTFEYRVQVDQMEVPF